MEQIIKIQVLLFVFLFIFCAPTKAEENTIALFEIGPSRDQPISIQPGVNYFVDVLGSGWFSMTASQDGTYFFLLQKNSGTSTMDFTLYTRFKEILVDFHTGYGGDANPSIASCELSEGETYYIYFYDGCPGYISICAPNQHVLPGQAEIVAQPSCTETGQSVVSCKSCHSEIGKQEIPPTGHTSGEWTTTTAASCTLPGVLSQKCSVCGEILATQELPATGHTPGKWTLAMEADCLQIGLKTLQCTVCQEVLESETIPLAEHTPGSMNTVAPVTCTEDGYGEQRCTLCNALLSSENIPAHGHKGGTWTETIPATCETSGERILCCQLCNVILESETIPATGH